MEDLDEFDVGFQEAIEPPESGDDSPEGRLQKASKLVDYVRSNYPGQLPTLRSITAMASRDYAQDPCQETKWVLMARIQDEVSCVLALEHVQDVADHIIEGWDAADYAFGQDREFLATCRARFDGIREAIQDAQPQQMRFAFAG